MKGAIKKDASGKNLSAHVAISTIIEFYNSGGKAEVVNKQTNIKRYKKSIN